MPAMEPDHRRQGRLVELDQGARGPAGARSDRMSETRHFLAGLDREKVLRRLAVVCGFKRKFSGFFREYPQMRERPWRVAGLH
jgi:hypothetical protein